MIKFENTEVFGFEAAIRGMRNPHDSWDKSDSYTELAPNPHYEIGQQDFELMKKLVSAGGDHRKFMRMIHVQVDITAPLYWWKEFDTYKVGTTSNSCSTMHSIHKKEFTLDDFSHEHLENLKTWTMLGTLEVPLYHNFEDDLSNLIDTLNLVRKLYLETKDKTYWWQMIQLLPSSYNQRRTIDLDYEVLRNMYHARKNHKLDEWSVGFTEWVESLPYSELITM